LGTVDNNLGGWSGLKAQFIEDFLVLGVENIPDELVVNAHPVLEIAGFKTA